MSTIKIYHAGPQVFEKDAIEIFEYRSTYVKNISPELELIVPFDLSLIEHEEIKKKNVDMIKESHIIVADISPFLGYTMDPGTAYEIGYAEALDKEVYLYSNNQNSLIQRIPDDWIHNKNYENFDLAENLMIASNQVVYNTFQECINEIKSVHLDNVKNLYV